MKLSDRKFVLNSTEMSSRSIYGWQPVWEAVSLHPSRIDAVYISEDLSSTKKAKIISLCKKAGVVFKQRPPVFFHRLASKEGQKIVHQGVMAVLKNFHYVRLEDLLKSKPDLILLLDHLQDPQNVGNIIRSAAAFGVKGIIIPKDRSASISPTVIKASAGMALRLPIIRVTNLAQTISQLKKGGFWIVGTVSQEAQPIWELPPDLPLALIIGHEHKGISRLLREKCDFLVNIPLKEGVDSLNVANATAICLYEIWRKKLD